MGFLLLIEYSIFPVQLILSFLQLFKTILHILLYYTFGQIHTLSKCKKCFTNTFLPPEQLLLPRPLHWLSKGNSIP